MSVSSNSTSVLLATTYYDMQGSNTGQSPTASGFMDAVLADGMVYYVPDKEGTSGVIGMQNTGLNLGYPLAYSFFDATAVSTSAKGFSGAVYDGTLTPAVPPTSITAKATSNPKYLYYIPGNSGTLVRYDTTQNFSSTSSYSTFDTSLIHPNSATFSGGVFDGTNLYLVPNNEGNSGQVTMYNTTASFNSTSSYAVFDMALNVNSGSKGFSSAAYDGSRYVYFAPGPNFNAGTASGLVTRYDTFGAFGTASSYSTFDLQANISTNAMGFSRVVHDGANFLYFIPNSNGLSYTGAVVRLNTSSPSNFSSTSSYQVLNSPLGYSGFSSAAFDGSGKLHLVPYANNADVNTPFGQTAAYASLVPSISQSTFTFDSASYTANGMANSIRSQGFAGGVCDGSTLYLAPNTALPSGSNANSNPTISTFSGQISMLNVGPTNGRFTRK